ncbi:MAG: transcriptional regulator [Mariniphaga sp.]|nr:transcriptional regulator [Mariniphaga sp.]
MDRNKVLYATIKWHSFDRNEWYTFDRFIYFAQRLNKARTDKGCPKPALQNWWGPHYTEIGRYEKKGAQPAADILSRLANSLGVSSEYLTNGTSDDLAESSLTDKELLNQFKAIEKMNDNDKGVVKTLIDAFITKGKLKQLVL